MSSSKRKATAKANGQRAQKKQKEKKEGDTLKSTLEILSAVREISKSHCIGLDVAAMMDRSLGTTEEEEQGSDDEKEDAFTFQGYKAPGVKPTDLMTLQKACNDACKPIRSLHDRVNFFNLDNAMHEKKPEIRLADGDKLVWSPADAIGNEEAFELLKIADPSGFGNVKEQTTDYDKKVRDAYEIPADKFKIDASLTDELATMWSKQFLPSTLIRVVPYKMSIYLKGGHFQAHRDTPEKGLVGTALVRLQNHFGAPCSELELLSRGKWITWHRYTDICMFYTDVPHTVQTNKEGDDPRVIMAFKVYCDGDVPVLTDKSQIDETAQRIKSKMSGVLGFKLSHDYSLRADSLKGMDRLFFEAVQRLKPKAWCLMPTATKFTAEGVKEKMARVYSCREEDLVAIRDQTDLKPLPDWLKKTKDVPVLSLITGESDDVEVDRETREAIEYTGNDSQSASVDALYLSRVLFVAF
jgi:hypothetical protein